MKTTKRAAAAPKPKGFIGKFGTYTFYTNGQDVFCAAPGAVADTQSGYLIGRWECSVSHWNRFSQTVYGLPPVATSLIRNKS